MGQIISIRKVELAKKT